MKTWCLSKVIFHDTESEFQSLLMIILLAVIKIFAVVKSKKLLCSCKSVLL